MGCPALFLGFVYIELADCITGAVPPASPWGLRLLDQVVLIDDKAASWGSETNENPGFRSRFRNSGPKLPKAIQMKYNQVQVTCSRSVMCISSKRAWFRFLHSYSLINCQLSLFLSFYSSTYDLTLLTRDILDVDIMPFSVFWWIFHCFKLYTVWHVSFSHLPASLILFIVVMFNHLTLFSLSHLTSHPCYCHAISDTYGLCICSRKLHQRSLQGMDSPCCFKPQEMLARSVSIAPELQLMQKTF